VQLVDLGRTGGRRRRRRSAARSRVRGVRIGWELASGGLNDALDNTLIGWRQSGDNRLNKRRRIFRRHGAGERQRGQLRQRGAIGGTRHSGGIDVNGDTNAMRMKPRVQRFAQLDDVVDAHQPVLAGITA
jgi:hypothetical protein